MTIPPDLRKHYQLKDVYPFTISECSIEVTPNSNCSELNKYKNMAYRKDVPLLTVALIVEAANLVTFDAENVYLHASLGLKI